MSELSDVSINDDAIRELLSQTRTGIANGDRDAALASIVSAISLTRGPHMVLQTLSNAKDRAKAEKEMLEKEAERVYNKALLDLAEENSKSLLTHDSILRARDDGSELILRDAFEDGSSVICTKCNSLVKVTRWEAHLNMWCPNLPIVTDMEIDEADDP
jgi:hypothetical protein